MWRGPGHERPLAALVLSAGWMLGICGGGEISVYAPLSPLIEEVELVLTGDAPKGAVVSEALRVENLWSVGIPD